MLVLESRSGFIQLGWLAMADQRSRCIVDSKTRLICWPPGELPSPILAGLGGEDHFYPSFDLLPVSPLGGENQAQNVCL